MKLLEIKFSLRIKGLSIMIYMIFNNMSMIETDYLN